MVSKAEGRGNQARAGLEPHQSPAERPNMMLAETLLSSTVKQDTGDWTGIQSSTEDESQIPYKG